MERKSGTRADRAVHAAFPGLSGRQIDEALERGLVRDRQGHRLKKGARVVAVDAIESSALVAHLEKLSEGNRNLEVSVAHTETDFVVVDKPAGMASHPLSLFDTDTVTHWALATFPEVRAEFPEPQPKVTPHRLDGGTTGCLVVARTAAAYRSWRERFAAHEVTKSYLAWCWGRPNEKSFIVEAPLAHDSADRTRMKIDDGGRPARTEVAVESIDEVRGLFLARVTCRSGVTHQVRAHLASRGFPLAGDTRYDAAASARPWRPAHHQLRAVSLAVDGRCYRVDEASFRNVD